VADRGANRFAANDTLQAELPHQPLHRASRNIEPFPLHLSPSLPDAIDREVLGKDPHDLRLEGFVALGTCRQPRGIPALGNTLMISGWGDWQDAADRLDPIMPTLLVDKGDHRFSGPSSSASAKYAEALRRISLACRCSRFSGSTAWSCSAPSLGTPAPRPPSTSACFTQSSRVWAEQPSFWETETTAAPRDGYSPPCSSTIRTARVRTSGENLFVVLLIRLYPTWELEPPTVPARFIPVSRRHRRCDGRLPPILPRRGPRYRYRAAAECRIPA